MLVELFTGRQPYTDLIGLHPAQVRSYSRVAPLTLTLTPTPTVAEQLVLKITQGLRPNITDLPPSLQYIVAECLDENTALRPSFSELVPRLERMKAPDGSFNGFGSDEQWASPLTQSATATTSSIDGYQSWQMPHTGDEDILLLATAVEPGGLDDTPQGVHHSSDDEQSIQEV